MNQEACQRWLTAWESALTNGTLVKATLSRPVTAEGPQKVMLRTVELKAGKRVSVVSRFATRDMTENHRESEATDWLKEQLSHGFLSASLHTTEAVFYLDKKGPNWIFRRGPAAHAEAPVAHNREKVRRLDPSSDWRQGLGLFADGRLKPGMEAKGRQIERFVELLEHWLGKELPPKLRIVDMGCGKGYLTFAVAEWVQKIGLEAEIVGVERRADLVDHCNRVATSCGFAHLKFMLGSIADTPLEGVDLVIALHACDTATDDALANGVLANARWLMVAPCCHKQCRPQLRPPVALESTWKHGILLEREAEIATDALRAELLQAVGYRARVFEFVATEHTAKNLMITASRERPDGEPAPAIALAKYYGIQRHQLADRLGISLEE